MAATSDSSIKLQFFLGTPIVPIVIPGGFRGAGGVILLGCSGSGLLGKLPSFLVSVAPKAINGHVETVQVREKRLVSLTHIIEEAPDLFKSFPGESFRRGIKEIFQLIDKSLGFLPLLVTDKSEDSSNSPDHAASPRPWILPAVSSLSGGILEP